MNFEMRILADGRATLYRGDSLDLLRAGVFGKIGAIVSDPPYGIGLQASRGGSGEMIKGSSNPRGIHGDDVPFDPMPWIEAAPEWLHAETKAMGHRIMLWGADHYMQRLPHGGTMLAWDKHLGRGPDDSFADCEWAWIGRARVRREVFRYLWKGLLASTTSLDLPHLG